MTRRSSRRAAPMPDARRAAPTPDARRAASMPDARRVASMPDARRAASMPDARRAATMPDGRRAASMPDARSAGLQPCPGSPKGLRYIAFLLLSISLAAQQPFRSTVEGVTIQASVRAGNRPVGGLTAKDFELRDNGIAQHITAVAAEQLPLDLTLLLDSSASVDGPTLQRLESAVNDTVSLLRPDDRIRLIAVSQVLHQLFDFRPKGESIPLETLGAQGATSLYDALAAGMMRVSEPGRRQLVIAFTDGRDSTSILDEAATRQLARLTDTVVDIVIPLAKEEQPPDRPASNYGLRQPLDAVLQSSSNVVTGSPSELADRARDLKPWARKEALTAILADLVASTTGQVFTLEPKDSISRAFRRVLEDFRASYVIEYVPSGVPSGGWHDVSVTVLKPGKYDVRARKGYEGRDNK